MVPQGGDRLLRVGMLVGMATGCMTVAARGTQTVTVPTLAEVIDRMRDNYVEYVTSVPNLFCDEKVRSEYGLYMSPSKPSRTVTESIFRLQRKMSTDNKPTLGESRQVRKVDGKAVEKDQLSGPSILYGVFGSSVGFVSKEQESCVVFKVKGNVVHLGRRRVEIEFKPLPAGERDAACGERRWRGKAFIDLETMHLARLEMKTESYEIVKGVRGDWNWEADYEPVVLIGKPFWLPVTIRSQAISYEIHPQEWTFDAEYRNYHKMAATGRIVPGTVEELPGGDREATPP